MAKYVNSCPGSYLKYIQKLLINFGGLIWHIFQYVERICLNTTDYNFSFLALQYNSN